MPEMAPFTAFSIWASAKTMFGDLPPSSRVTCLMFLAAWVYTAAPVASPPVNATLATSG
ncbi:hypothetical protein D3C80_1779230 [compost metagenome]